MARTYGWLSWQLLRLPIPSSSALTHKQILSSGVCRVPSMPRSRSPNLFVEKDKREGLRWGRGAVREQHAAGPQIDPAVGMQESALGLRASALGSGIWV